MGAIQVAMCGSGEIAARESSSSPDGTTLSFTVTATWPVVGLYWILAVLEGRHLQVADGVHVAGGQTQRTCRTVDAGDPPACRPGRVGSSRFPGSCPG